MAAVRRTRRTSTRAASTTRSGSPRSAGRPRARRAPSRSGMQGQAERIARLFARVRTPREKLGSAGLVYYNWRDSEPFEGGFDFFGLHTGLLTLERVEKPRLSNLRAWREAPLGLTATRGALGCFQSRSRGQGVSRGTLPAFQTRKDGSCSLALASFRSQVLSPRSRWRQPPAPPVPKDFVGIDSQDTFQAAFNNDLDAMSANLTAQNGDRHRHPSAAVQLAVDRDAEGQVQLRDARSLHGADGGAGHARPPGPLRRTEIPLRRGENLKKGIVARPRTAPLWQVRELPW